jgi:hypothetical protein
MKIVEKYRSYRELGMESQGALLTAIAERVSSYQQRFLLWREKPISSVTGAMHWFKHRTDFGDSPEMRYVERAGGLEAVAVAYRLIEFMAKRHGDDGGFSGELVMSAPNTKNMLAERLVGVREDGLPAGPKDLENFLDVFESAGLIERGLLNLPGTRLIEGQRVKCDLEIETLRLLKVNDGWEDDYTARKQRKS